MNKKQLAIIAVVIGIISASIGFIALSKAMSFTGLKVACIWKIVVSPDNDPEMYKTPVPLTKTNTSSAVKTSFTNSIYSFSTPWLGSEVLADTNVVIYTYTNGVKLFFGLDDAPYVVGMNQFRETTDDATYDMVKTLLSSANINTLQDIFEATLYSTPHDISFFSTREEASVKHFLLTMKVVAAISGTPMFSFDFVGGKGFQLGDPAEDSHIELLLFDSPNTARSIDVGWGDDCIVSQEELNCIIQSLKKCEPVK